MKVFSLCVMSFLSKSCEIHPEMMGKNILFEQELSEGKQVVFVGHFPVEISAPDALAEALFAAVVDGLQSNSVSDPYDRFEEAIKTANDVAKKYLPNGVPLPSISIGFFDFIDLYLTQTGQAETYLLRGSELSSIKEQGEGKDLFQNILSGKVSLNDTIVMSTQGILESVSSKLLVDTLLGNEFEESVDVLCPMLDSLVPSKGFLLFVGVGKIAKVVETPSAFGALKNAGKSSVLGMISGLKDKVQGKKPSVLSTEDISALLPQNKPKLPPISQKTMKIAGGILGILVISLIGRSIMNNESEKTAELRTNIEVAQQALVEVDQLLAQGNRDEASVRIESAHKAVDFVLRSGEKEFRITAQEILKEIEDRRLASENAEKTPATPLADLGLTLNNVNAQSVVNDGNTNYILDTRNVHRVIRSNVEPGPSISEDETETIVAGSMRPGTSRMVVLTDTPRIIEYYERTLSPMSTDDDVWKSGIDIATYGRFAYVLDPVNNQIWKYERRRSSYGGSSAYNVDSKADLSQAVSMTIDGAIYVLSADGTVQKLFRGALAPFTLEGLPSLALEGSELKIQTGTGYDFLYMLDPTNQRLLVLQKTDDKAIYKKQILFDVPDVIDFTVNNDESRATLITKERVYDVSL